MTAVDELTAMLASVIAEPAEDTVRLAYADALEERGLPGDANRAAFVRWQIATNITFTRKNRRWERSRRNPRARRVANEVPSEMWQALNGFLSEPHCLQQFTISRGFISDLTCPAERWLLHANQLAWRPQQQRACPPTANPLRTITLTGSIECELTANVLTVRSGGVTRTYRHIFTSEQLRTVTIANLLNAIHDPIKFRVEN